MPNRFQLETTLEILANAMIVVLEAARVLVDETATSTDRQRMSRALLDQIAKVETVFTH